MDTEVIIIIIMAAILLFWIIFCVCLMLRRISKVISRSNLKAHVQCEKCGCIFDASLKEATHSPFTKTKSTTKTKIQGGAFVNKPVYSSYAKKFHCPNCGKKTYGRVLNLEEIQDSLRVPRTKEIVKGFAMMLIGGITIVILMQIPMHFANKAKEKKIEQMRQQQYEDIKEKYWN